MASNCSGLLGRTPLRLDPPLSSGSGSGDCSGLLGRTPLRPLGEMTDHAWILHCSGLLGRTPLRPGRPARSLRWPQPHCSGLLGRTPLRPGLARRRYARRPRLFRSSRPDSIETECRGCGRKPKRRLFRSSRPDSIETSRWPVEACVPYNCSGLLGRTPLRRNAVAMRVLRLFHCSGLLGRTPLRHPGTAPARDLYEILFRSSRPDSIETGS